MPREHHNDTSPPASRARQRVRRVVFSRRYPAPMTPAQKADMTAALELLTEDGGDFAWINHTHPESHAQGAIRFPDKRELSSIAAALGVEVTAVRPLGRAPLAFARSCKYLPHPGEWDEYPPEAVMSNFDWRAEVARLPAAKAPTLSVLTKALYDGELTPEQAAERWPDLFLRHAPKLTKAHRLGLDHAATRAAEAAEAAYNAPEAVAAREADAEAALQAQRAREAEAERRADHEAAERAAYEAERAERRAEREAAEAAFWASPEGIAKRAEMDAAQAQNAAEEHLFWLVAMVADLCGIAGRDGERRAELSQRIGEPTAENLTDFWTDWWSCEPADVTADLVAFRDECTAVAGRIQFAEFHIVDGVSDPAHAIATAGAGRAAMARHPDLYGRVPPFDVRLTKAQQAAITKAAEAAAAPNSSTG